MRLAIIVDSLLRNDTFVIHFLEVAKRNNVSLRLVDISNESNISFEEDEVVVFRWLHTDDHHQLARTLIPLWEFHLKKKVFPNWNTCWHFDDKISQYLLCEAHALPYTESWIFWNREEALRWSENAPYPVVFKLKGGAGSSNVVLVRKKAEAVKLIKAMFGKGVRQWHVPSADNVWFHPSSFVKTIKWHLLNLMRSFRGEDPMEGYLPHKNYALFQKFLPGNEFDTRVTVIGGCAFAFRRMNRKNDFRSSGSGKIDYDQNKIDKRCIELAFKISSELHFQSMAYDFLKNEKGGIEFCEMSYTYDDNAIYNCPGHWNRDLCFVRDHVWPQEVIIKEIFCSSTNT